MVNKHVPQLASDPLFPEIEPYDHGIISVGEGNQIYWETCGNSQGKPALVIHGGPGSGATPWWRRLFDPRKYRIILFDQRNCGKSTPNASEPRVDLSSNNTGNLIQDIEKLRKHLKIDQWLVLGGSWGSTLSIAYAEDFPEHVSELVLFGVTTGRRSEFNWMFRGGVATFFPDQWRELVAGILDEYSSLDIVESYQRMLFDSDPDVRDRAASSWCKWESATADWPPKGAVQKRFLDPRFSLAFARIVTHFVRHNAWLPDNALIDNSSCLSETPLLMINGRYDFQSPIGNAYALKDKLPHAELIVVDNSGHTPEVSINKELVRGTTKFLHK